MELSQKVQNVKIPYAVRGFDDDSGNNRESSRRKSFLTYKDRFLSVFADFIWCSIHWKVSMYLLSFHMLNSDLSLHRFHLLFNLETFPVFFISHRLDILRFQRKLNLDSLSIQLNMTTWNDTCTESHGSIIDSFENFFSINSSNKSTWRCCRLTLTGRECLKRNFTLECVLNEWSLFWEDSTSIFIFIFWNMM